jgi:hypothetical protein
MGCGDPESCEQNLGEGQANADAKMYAGQGQEAEEARAAAVAEGQLQSALRNPYQYRNLDYDYVYRKLVGDAHSAGWDVTIAKNDLGVVIHEPGTTAQIRIMVPSKAPPGAPNSFFRLVVGKAHVNLRP